MSRGNCFYPPEIPGIWLCLSQIPGHLFPSQVKSVEQFNLSFLSIYPVLSHTWQSGGAGPQGWVRQWSSRDVPWTGSISHIWGLVGNTHSWTLPSTHLLNQKLHVSTDSCWDPLDYSFLSFSFLISYNYFKKNKQRWGQCDIYWMPSMYQRPSNFPGNICDPHKAVLR